jgi:hypothetical protein
MGRGPLWGAPRRTTSHTLLHAEVIILHTTAGAILPP